MRARLRYRFRGCAARLRTVAIAANGFACLRRVEHPSAQPSVLRQCCHGEDLSMRAGLSAVAVLQPGLVDRSFAQPHLRPKRSMNSVVCPTRARYPLLLRRGAAASAARRNHGGLRQRGGPRSTVLDCGKSSSEPTVTADDRSLSQAAAELVSLGASALVTNVTKEL